MMVAIFNSAILNSANLDSASVLWNSDTLFSSLRFTQKHSPSILTLTQTNSIWLKLIHSDSTWWRQPSLSLPTWFQPFCTKNFTHSFWLNLMMAAILNLAILDSGILVFPLKPTHTCQDWFPPFAEKKIHSHFPPKFRIWLNLIQSDSNSFILTQLDDDSHLEFCHLGFSHFGQIKLHSFILTSIYDGSHLEFCQMDSATTILDLDTLLSSLRFTQKHSPSILTLTQTNSFWLKLIHSHLT